MRISLSGAAQSDLDAALDWYLEQLAFAAADGCADEFEQALTLLARFPNLGVHGRHGTRVFTLQKFPYSLIYQVFPEHLRVVAIAHHSRRPGYWAGRR